MEHNRRRPDLRVLLVGVPLMLGEMVTELIQSETESMLVTTCGILEAEGKLATGAYDLVITELTVTGLPVALESFRTRDQPFAMLAIGDSGAVVYERSTAPFDLGDKSLRDVLAEARNAAFAHKTRRDT